MADLVDKLALKSARIAALQVELDQMTLWRDNTIKQNTFLEGEIDKLDHELGEANAEIARHHANFAQIAGLLGNYFETPESFENASACLHAIRRVTGEQ